MTASDIAIPHSWSFAALGELLEPLQYGYTATAQAGRAGPRLLRITDIDANGHIVWSSVPGCQVSPDDHEKYRLADGDLVFARTGSIEKACLVRNPPAAVFASYLIRGRPWDSRLAEWLAIFVRSSSYIQQAKTASAGIGRPNINAKNLAKLRLVIPPFPEQSRIVDSLDSLFSRLDEAEAALERVQRNLKRYRAAVLQAAVEGRLVPTEAELARAEGRDYEPASELLKRILAERRRRWEEIELARLKSAGKVPKDDKWKAKYNEPAVHESIGLPDLPEGWCWATLPQFGEMNRGKSKHRPRNDPRLLGGPYPFIQTGDIKKADGFIKTYEATYSEIGRAQSRLWPCGTLCITIAANIAETGILQFDACFPDSVVGFLNPSQPLLTRYVEFFLRTARARLEQFAPATAQKNINIETLSEVAIPLPPSSELERIVTELDDALSVAARIDEVIEGTTRRNGKLRQSILKWAFEGRLVDQDPNDEPASVLLERIRAERAAQAQPPQRRSRKQKVPTP